MTTSKTTLPVGQRCYWGLYGGRYGVVAEVKQNRYVVAFPDCIHDIPACMLPSSQWELRDGIADEAEIKATIESAAKEKERKRLAKIAADDQFKAAVESVKTDEKFGHLSPVTSCGGVEAAKNVRKMLKKHFPGFKFSVKSDYTAVNIYWTNGPTASQVDDVVMMFKAGNFNGMEDIYEFQKTPFNDVYGSVQYVFTNREMTAEAKRMAFEDEFPGGLRCNGIHVTSFDDQAKRQDYNSKTLVHQSVHGRSFDVGGKLIPNK
jgi:hypothetical protein